MTDLAASPPPLDAETVRRLAGDILDATVAAILATGANVKELEAALAWLNGQDLAAGESRPPLSGAAAAVYDLLAAEILAPDER